MLRILFIAPTGTLDNGAEISIFYLMKYLSMQGYKISVVAPSSYRKQMESYSKTLSAYGIDVYHISVLKWWWEEAPSPSPGSIEERAYYYRDNVNKIAELITKLGIQLVISNTVNVFQGSLAAAICHVPHWWLIHEFPMGEFEYYQSKVNFIENNSDLIFCVQGELTIAAKKLFTKSIVNSFIPYTEICSKNIISAEKNRIISIGRITPRKNQLELIKSFSKLNRVGLELILIGGWDDSYKYECDQYIKSNRIENVTFTGNLDDPWSVVTDKDICILPSIMETYGLVYVEAILNGVPVISSDNLGFISAFSYFNIGQHYGLRDSSMLTNIINNTLDNYTEVKDSALKSVAQAKKKYSVEIAYSDILNELDKKISYADKNISHLENVLKLNAVETWQTKSLVEMRSKISRVKSRISSFLYRRNRDRLN